MITCARHEDEIHFSYRPWLAKRTAGHGMNADLIDIAKCNLLIDEMNFSASDIAADKVITSDMLWYAAAMANKRVSPEKILGTHNKRQENYRSPDGFLLGWAADEALAAAIYIFLRHPNDMQAALTEAVNTPGDSDSIATIVGALVGARIGFKAFERNYNWHDLENYDGLCKAADFAHGVVSADSFSKLLKM